MFNKKNSSVTLSSFVRGMVQSLIDAQQAIRASRERNFEECMDIDDEGVRHLHMMTVKRPDGVLLSVPEYSLYRSSTIGITKSQISFCTKIMSFEIVDDSKVTDNGMSADRHARFWVKPAATGDKNTFEMRIEFEQRDASEAEERLIESLDSLVVESTDIDNPEK